MERLIRSIRCAAFAAALGVGALGVGSQTALAQAEQPPAENPAAAAKRSYEGGVKAYNAGRHQNAVDQFNLALRGGGLSSAEMAKGLYYRGLSYKKLNKPGLAISDLTSALWLKNGLSDSDRASAEAARAEAYKAAGVAEGPAPVAARSGPPEAAPAPAAVGAPAPAPAATAAAPAAPAPAMSNFQPSGQQAASSDGGFPQPLTMGAETAVPPPPRYARSETSGTINQAAALDQPTSVASNYVSTGAAPQAAQAQPALSAAPMAEGTGTPAPAPSAGGALAGVSGFFSNLFGGNSTSSPTQAPSAVATASTHPAPPVTPQTSSWSGGTSMTEGNAKKMAAAPKPAAAAPVQTAALAPAAAPAAPKVKGGKYKIHVAAVRSRAEAEALAQRLNAEHGKALASRMATVDEATIGSMGKFYRVRVGSYPTADEPRGLCNTLRNSGYDCLVVTN